MTEEGRVAGWTRCPYDSPEYASATLATLATRNPHGTHAMRFRIEYCVV